MRLADRSCRPRGQAPILQGVDAPLGCPELATERHESPRRGGRRVMTLCLIGKYPPIEGGVARATFWAAFALAQHGVSTHVVTNAREVEEEFRIFDEPWAPDLPPDPRIVAGERLRVHYTSQDSGRGYVPWVNPFVTKLAALATDVVEAHGCDLIYAHYFEPYGLAANLTASWTGVPFGVRHAGSDVGSLLLAPELRTAYTRMLRAADYVVASGSTFRRFLRLGVPFERLLRLPPAALPEQYFHPDARPLDVAGLLRAIDARLPRSFYDGLYHQASGRSFDSTRPTIGIYGKVGETKGSYDLVRALGQLKRQGLQFNFVALTQGYRARMTALTRAIAEHGLVADTWLLPFLPHWYVPNFIRACTAVCFLERQFPIAIHRPSVPREVLACGTALVLSREAAARRSDPEALRDGENVWLADPLDTDELAAVLRRCVEDPSRAREVGLNGCRELGSDYAPFDVYAEVLADTFRSLPRAVAARRQTRAQGGMGGRVARSSGAVDTRVVAGDLAAACDSPPAAGSTCEPTGAPATWRAEFPRTHYPATFALDATVLARYAARYDAHQPTTTETLDYLLSFGGFLAEVLPDEPVLPPFAADLARYEGLLLAARYQPGPDDVFAGINRPANRPASLVPLDARLSVGRGLQIAVFAYDVVALADAVAAGALPGDAQPAECCLVVQQMPNSLSPRVLRLQALARLVLALCDGRRTVADIGRTVEQLAGGPNAAAVVLGLCNRLAALDLVRLDERPLRSPRARATDDRPGPAS
jgi:glycosyltransferase involved in cell wall biosynthesis